MTEAKTITEGNDASRLLTMIESVDPSDTATMNEIDTRFWAWYNGVTILKLRRFGIDSSKSLRGEIKCIRSKEYGDLPRLWPHTVVPNSTPLLKYTRSRDVLKAIRPDGWMFYIDNFDRELSYFQITGWCKHTEVITPPIATEELAELHAIIQAIEYERSTKSK